MSHIYRRSTRAERMAMKATREDLEYYSRIKGETQMVGTMVNDGACRCGCEELCHNERGHCMGCGKCERFVRKDA